MLIRSPFAAAAPVPWAVHWPASGAPNALPPASADFSVLEGKLDKAALRDVDALSGRKLRQRSVPCNPALSQLAKSRKVLLLQGPVGSFYDRLTRWLHAGGAEVHRVAFQGGDEHDCQLLKPIAYRGTPGGWPAFLTNKARILANIT